MFRDSRGVVHTVCSPDPLGDLPSGAARALQEALLVPPGPGRPVDVGGVLELAEAVRDLLGRWQDAFFAALPDEVDLQEEARWAAEAGLSLAEVESDADADVDTDLDTEHDTEHDTGRDEEADLELLDLELLDLDLDRDRAVDGTGGPLPDDLLGPDDLDLLVRAPGETDPRTALPEPLVTALERELLLLPVRVRLEALVAADDLVQEWVELVADQEKLLGHLVLQHGQLPHPGSLGHDDLAGRHAALHAADGPGHPDRARR